MGGFLEIVFIVFGGSRLFSGFIGGAIGYRRRAVSSSGLRLGVSQRDAVVQILRKVSHFLLLNLNVYKYYKIS